MGKLTEDAPNKPVLRVGLEHSINRIENGKPSGQAGADIWPHVLARCRMPIF